ncbi:MAG: tRNA lysidine(34) synthetase TilS [Xanthomonadales bacterium]|nr:tRNA lysidine(34) synthetase TilS [Xanthomonadales bacterium]
MSVDLQAQLRAALADVADAALCVAYSGGPDSTALLHALAQLPEARARGLRAVHVDHRLQAQSPAWAEHCRAFCATLDVPLTVVVAQVRRGRGNGLEAAAREARYAAMAAELRRGECLVLAQHRDDQAETVLLKLLRGAGPEGLGGMRPLRAFGAGALWRPLLACPREDLLGYVGAARLPVIEDPSNADTRLARNFLRHRIMPQLLQQWPQAVCAIVHSAQLNRAAADALQARWLPELERLRDPANNSLDTAGWLALDPALRHPMLDHWLHAAGLHAPTTAQRQQIERQCQAQAGRVPCIRWRDTELRIWKGRLWAMSPQEPPPADWTIAWEGQEVILPGGGSFALHPADARLPAPVTLRLRQGGERLKPMGTPYTRDVRDLFQQGEVPPWQRHACPLVYDGDELLAVADRWASARGVALFAAAGARPSWRLCTAPVGPHPGSAD